VSFAILPDIKMLMSVNSRASGFTSHFILAEPPLEIFVIACIVYGAGMIVLYRNIPSRPWRDYLLLLFSSFASAGGIIAGFDAQGIALSILPWTTLAALVLSMFPVEACLGIQWRNDSACICCQCEMAGYDKCLHDKCTSCGHDPCESYTREVKG
jgi:hypothetical protein